MSPPSEKVGGNVPCVPHKIAPMVVARYCSDAEVHERLCCLKPMYGNTKGKDILAPFLKHVEEREIDIKMFLVTAEDIIKLSSSTY